MKSFLLKGFIGALCLLGTVHAVAKNNSIQACTNIFAEDSQIQLSKEQIKVVVQAVRKTFSILRKDPKFLPKMWANQNANSQVDSEGFCFAAANAVYHLLGGKAAGLTPMVAKYFDPQLLRADPESKGIATHWWIRKSDGTLIDPTKDQYTAYGEKPPYELGKGAGFNRPLTVPTIAGKKIMDLAKEFLREQGYRSNGLAI